MPASQIGTWAARKAWLAKHPRFHVHFTPTSSSPPGPAGPVPCTDRIEGLLAFDGVNLVERFFADLTGDVIRAGSFTSVKGLVADIQTYLAQRNADPRPYTWKAENAAILEKIHRARAALTCAGAVA